jgi:predicted GNAT family acetyltransferase
MTHVLDAPIWHALSGRQSAMSRRHGLALRYDPAFAPFAATASNAREALDDLHDLLAPGERAALFTPVEIVLPDRLVAHVRREADQMVLATAPAGSDALPTGTRSLTDADRDAALDLVALTHPGPFAARTLEMGRYIGVFRDGVLAAMAGERMALDGFAEISAVCTHPGHRGQGLARSLIAELAVEMHARGQTPFLHAFTDNQAALSVYRKLGFVRRATLHLVVVGRS